MDLKTCVQIRTKGSKVNMAEQVVNGTFVVQLDPEDL